MYTCLIGAYATAPLQEVLNAYAQLKASSIKMDSPFTEVYLVTVLQKPKAEVWDRGIMLRELRMRSPDRLAAAKDALDDFNALELELAWQCRVPCASCSHVGRSRVSESTMIHTCRRDTRE